MKGELWNAFCEAQEMAAMRDNSSTLIFRESLLASGDFNKALAAAVLSFGRLHGPIVLTKRFLLGGADRLVVGNKVRVPGWGSSFVKGQPDPIWSRVDDLLRGPTPADFPDTHMALGLACDRMRRQSEAFLDQGRKIYPNGACYSALMAISMGLPDEVAPMVVTVPRVRVWAEMARDLIKTTENLKGE